MVQGVGTLSSDAPARSRRSTKPAGLTLPIGSKDALRQPVPYPLQLEPASFIGSARSAKRFVTADQSLLVFGQDWSSIVPYYSERKSMALAPWIPRPIVQPMFDSPEEFLGEMRIAAIEYCPSQYRDDFTSLLTKSWPAESLDPSQDRDPPTAYDQHSRRHRAVTPLIDGFITGHKVLADTGQCKLLSADG
jgi:hypothetical protein